MNSKTKEQCHKILDALFDELEASGRNEDLFDISIKTVDVQQVENPETCVTEFRAEVVVDAEENAYIEDSERITEIFNYDNSRKVITRTPLEL